MSVNNVSGTNYFFVCLLLFFKVVEHLTSITGITSQSILEFSYAVLKHVIGSTTPKQHYRGFGTKAPQNGILSFK